MALYQHREAQYPAQPSYPEHYDRLGGRLTFDEFYQGYGYTQHRAFYENSTPGALAYYLGIQQAARKAYPNYHNEAVLYAGDITSQSHPGMISVAREWPSGWIAWDEYEQPDQDGEPKDEPEGYPVTVEKPNLREIEEIAITAEGVL